MQPRSIHSQISCYGMPVTGEVQNLFISTNTGNEVNLCPAFTNKKNVQLNICVFKQFRLKDTNIIQYFHQNEQ